MVVTAPAASREPRGLGARVLRLGAAGEVVLVIRTVAVFCID
jgi:hypothetical protein